MCLLCLFLNFVITEPIIFCMRKKQISVIYDSKLYTNSCVMKVRLKQVHEFSCLIYATIFQK